MTRAELIHAMARYGYDVEGDRESGAEYFEHVQDSPDDNYDHEFVTRVSGPHPGRLPCLTDTVQLVEFERLDLDSREGPSYYDTDYTMADVLAALANPSEEYSVLSLRLDNGLHRKSDAPIKGAPVFRILHADGDYAVCNKLAGTIDDHTVLPCEATTFTGEELLQFVVERTRSQLLGDFQGYRVVQ